MVDYSKSFIEVQFPVAKVSKESYKERKANLNQTLTGLGKWWGRKPLVMVRAAVLGALMPVTDNPEKDKEIFLKILSMDEKGLYLRKDKPIPTKSLYEILNPKERSKYLNEPDGNGKVSYQKGVNIQDKEYLQKLAFNRLSYDGKLTFCMRPEHLENLPEETWKEINEHLETKANSLQELIRELGKKRFGRNPKVGDCFAGGGSIPFEAARMGADVYASDLNPVASLLTWASLNIAGASNEEVEALREFQREVYEDVDKRVAEWGIEHNEKGDRADSYLYCNETLCPDCGYKVPLAPSWVIGSGTKTVALLKDNGRDGYDIKVVQGATKSEFVEAEKLTTIRDGKLACPHCNMETPISSVRGDRKDGNGNAVSGLRKWGKGDFLPRQDDVFLERLYAIRYVETYLDAKGNKKTRRYYVAPDENDLKREENVVGLLRDVFEEWQEKGYIPSMRIDGGYNTDQPMRERGWQYWHQLFNPRQLLVSGMFAETIDKLANNKEKIVVGILGLNKITDWNSKLCIWNVGAGTEKTQNTYTNQALNTLYNYGTRGTLMYKTNWFMNINNSLISAERNCYVADARSVETICDYWVSDPPYADAVNYHELTEFFLAWDSALIKKAFPEWYTDSKRVLAVKGVGQSFNESMIEIYRNLTNHMPDNGMQVVMFTHQDVKVWSELAMILWSAGLRVVSAWNVATETESGGLKKGNYVKGTVLLTLKKQTSEETVFQYELYEEIKSEVLNIIDSMRGLDDKSDPDFTDADYLLASYAASLKVLTSYKNIQGVDVSFWLNQPRDSKEENPIEALINKAVKVAYDNLIPQGFAKSIWKDMSHEERFFIRGLEIEMGGVYQVGAYQELARGFGVKDYKEMFNNFNANTARLMTPEEYKMKFLGGAGFNSSTLRHVLVAINETMKEESTSAGVSYLKSAFQEGNVYWSKKPMMVEMLKFASRLQHIEKMKHWHKPSYYSSLLQEALKNDGA